MAARSPARWMHRAGGGAEADAEFAGDDLGERGLAEPGRPVQQHVVQRLAAGAGGLDEDAEVLAGGLLADEFRQGLRAEAGLGGVLGAAGGGDGAVVAHGVGALSRACVRGAAKQEIGTTDARRCTQMGHGRAYRHGSPGWVVRFRTRGGITASTDRAAMLCVMAGLGPATHVFSCCQQQSRGWPAHRVKPGGMLRGHDTRRGSAVTPRTVRSGAVIRPPSAPAPSAPRGSRRPGGPCRPGAR